MIIPSTTSMPLSAHRVDPTVSIQSCRSNWVDPTVVRDDDFSVPIHGRALANLNDVAAAMGPGPHYVTGD